MSLTFTGIYKEIPIDGKLVVPSQKPPMECILETYVTVDIDKAVVIDTPLTYPETENAPPYDPLRKVIVAGTVNIKIKYSALVPDQKVHSAHFEVPFCTLIEWPDGPPQGTPIVIQPVVEKAVFVQEDGRRIFKAVLIRLDVYR
ncbi:MAG: hypothetical protein XD78_1773 [Desulfotomaculum sp. 46_296]|nr:MAG: hypothetical protein XD78_1773 [Desulfotomaculum sp. 46_296]HAU32374.1 hypothetical protein [Desulfotomaculum sp.]